MTGRRVFAAFPRWQIDATLTTTSPLHVGSGGETVRKCLENDKTSAPVAITAVAKDHRGRPYIPGASLRGALRARITRQDAALSVALFGEWPGGPKPEASNRTDGAGFLEVRNAYFKASAVALGPDAASPDGRHPHWCEKCATAVVADVAIDRETRTAAAEKLFHNEYVPPGLSFGVSILAHGLEGSEVAAIHDALRALSLQGLGAETGNGWGRLSLGGWAVTKRANPDSSPEDATKETEATRDGHDAKQAATPVSLHIELKFEGGFLVNEPSRAKAKGRGAQEGDPRPNHAPRLDSAGHPYLPARSFRGALRSQAERILRTLLGDQGACSTQAPCPPLKQPADLPKRALLGVGPDRFCLACRVFGGAGWRSQIEVSDFKQTEPADIKVQDFVAIDRFTGGAAGSRKFSASRAVCPSLGGDIGLSAAITPAARALLALTLRDLEEGDIYFGWGRSKGYGAVTATTNPSLRQTDLRPLLDLRSK